MIDKEAHRKQHSIKKERKLEKGKRGGKALESEP
jgi:hypothetical protein